MQTSLEVTNGLGRKISVSLPEQLSAEYKKRLGDATKHAKVDGFRKGKVPATLIEKRYGPAVLDETVHQLIRETLEKAFHEKGLQPAGTPVVEKIEANLGQPMTYVVSFEVFPDIQVVDLEGQEVETIAVEINDHDLEVVLEKLRQQHADWVEVDRASANNDKVMVDFEGFIDGQAFAGGKALDTAVIIGSNTMIPGFETGLIGHQSGEEFDLSVTFPENYGNKDLAGKAAIFKTRLHKVYEPKLPALDEEFVKKFGIEEGGIEKLREEMRRHMTREVKAVVAQKNKKVVFDKLLELNTFDVPAALIESEVERMNQIANQQMGRGKNVSEIPEALKASLREAALLRIRVALLMDAAIKQRAIQVDEARMKAKIEEMAMAYDNPDEFVQWYASDRSRSENLQGELLEEQLMDVLLKTAKHTVKTLSYEEAMKFQ